MNGKEGENDEMKPLVDAINRFVGEWDVIVPGADWEDYDRLMAGNNLRDFLEAYGYPKPMTCDKRK